MNIPDNYDIWIAEQERRDRLLAERPVCSCCEDPIQEEHYYEAGGQLICPDCMETHFRKEIEL